MIYLVGLGFIKRELFDGGRIDSFNLLDFLVFCLYVCLKVNKWN